MNWIKAHYKGILITVVVLIGCTILGVVLYPYYDSIKQALSSRESIRDFVLRFGPWAPIVFVLLQAGQVLFSPIPGNVTTLAGGFIFGPVMGFIWSALGLVIGSALAFLLARKLGQGFVVKMIGKKQFEKYNSFFSSRYVLSLLILFLVPFFPDDILCLIAGLSSLPFMVFMLFVVIGRLPGTFLTSLVGAGVIELSIWEWVVIGVISLIVMIVGYKYSNRFEEWLKKKMKG